MALNSLMTINVIYFLCVSIVLTHISLMSFLSDKGKQISPRCDATRRGVATGAILFAVISFIENEIKIKKNTPDAPKNENGLIQMIKMGKSIRHIWVKFYKFL